jgi:hypothetical protein
MGRAEDDDRVSAEQIARDALRQSGIPDDETTDELVRLMAEHVKVPGRRSELNYEYEDDSRDEPAPSMPQNDDGHPAG